MAIETTTQPVPTRHQVVSRKILWEGDLVYLYVPERAQVRTFDREGEKFTYLTFQLAICDGKAVDIFVKPAGSELIGSEVDGWPSICEKRLDDGRVYRYIEIELADESDLDEPVDRCITVVPVRADEVEILEGWTFFNIPHPFKRERKLRGTILLYPLGDKVRIRPTAAPQPAEAPADGEPEPTRQVVGTTGTDELLAQAVSESVPAPKPEPVRMGEVPRQARKPRRAAKPVAETIVETTDDPPASVTPRVDPAQLAQLAESGFGLRQQDGAIPVF